MHYKTVFQVTDKVFDLIPFIPVLFFLIGLGIIWFNIKQNKTNPGKRPSTLIFGYLFSGISLIVALVFIPATIIDRNKTKKIFENKDYQVVEGKIENFHPMPKEGHENESFSVKNIFFEYSDFELIYGFNNTASHGGPLKENGQEVRLSYITNKAGENRILKIELKQ